MEIKVRVIDNQMCKVHFSMTQTRAIKLFNDLKVGTSLDDKIIETLFYSTVEKQFLEQELVKKGIVSVGEKKIHYLSPYSETHPLIGVATFITLPEVINLSLPMAIPVYIEEAIKDKIKECDESFYYTLLDAGMYYEEETDIVDETCEISYELIYTKDKQVLNTIKNQKFDLYNDEDLDSSLFIGAHVGDQIIIDQQDVNVEAVIIDILKKVPFSQSKYELDLVQEIGCPDFKTMYERFCDIYKLVTTREAYADFISDFAAIHTDINVTDEIFNFYKGKKYFPYIDDFLDAKDEKEQRSAIKRSLIFDLLIRMIELKTSDIYTDKEEFFKVNEELSTYFLTNDYDITDVNFELCKIKLLQYCKDEKIIKGINI